MSEDSHTPTDEARLRGLLRRASGALPTGDAVAAVDAVRRKVRWHRFVRTTTVGATALAVTGAAVLIVGGGRGASPPTGVRPAPPFRLAGALVSFSGCPDYLSYLRRQAGTVVGPYGLTPPGGYYSGFALQRQLAGPAFVGRAPAGALAPTVVSHDALVHSGTTNQVAGVDEPDVVKTDGRVVVTLTGPTLRVLDTSAHVLGSLQLSGDTGGGALLVGNRLVVLSSPSQPPSFPTPFRGFGFGGMIPVRPVTPATAAQAIVVDLADPSHPTIVRTFTFDGSIVAARLVGGSIRLVLRTDGPRITFQTPTSDGDLAIATAANRRLVATSTVADWSPAWQVRDPQGATSARTPVSTCTAVARPAHVSGLSTVSVLALDPFAAAPGPATSVVAAGDTIYASAEHVYVAGVSDGTLRPGVGYAVGARTWIYDFSTPAGGSPQFLGAGSVPGTLLNSYAMDEDSGGRLRVTSTSATVSADGQGGTDSRVTVLAQMGEALIAMGVVGNLGHGQQVRAVRFVGDSAYVVTYRVFDPLYVVDLRDPHRPVVAGALEQPGFSEFLYPLPHGRLLGVGVEITNNEPSGLLLSTYDVSDPAHPRRIDAAPIATGFAVAYGGYDPHAFLYWAATSLAVVALPNANGDVTGAGAYRIGSAGQLARLATLAHGTLTPARTAVIGDEVWAFTSGGVLVSSLSNLAAQTWHAY